jgi:protein MpaA
MSQPLAVGCLISILLSASSLVFANAQSEVMKRAFISSSSINPETMAEFRIDSTQQAALIKDFCERVSAKFTSLGWEKDPCANLPWRATLQTAKKSPLLYLAFGTGTDATLILSAVHPDEMTPVPMGFRLAKHLAEHPELLRPDQQVIIAPLVNPDGFLIKKPTRTNARGVDANRNFFTMDWYEKSISWWKSLKEKRPSHFPGHFPNSEIETIFQVRLIDDYQPDKILSVHAPLGFLDYDGPGDQKRQVLSPIEKQAKSLADAISRKSNNYRVVDYSFYPGSLGNFAGNERQIPTITLELATTDVKKVDAYWSQFLPGLLQAISYPFKKSLEKGNNTQKFYSNYDDPPQTVQDKS